MKWIISNKEWLFSGIGIILFSIIISFFKKIKNQIKKINKKGVNITSNNNENSAKNNSFRKINTHNEKEEVNNMEKNSILDFVDKFLLVYKEHGISISQIPTFIDKKFDIQFSDLLSKEMLLKKINDELINWTCNKFGIERKWFDNDNKDVYRTINCYKEVYKFREIISNLIDEVGLYDYKSEIEVIVLKNFNKLKADDTKGRTKISFVVRVKIGETSTNWVFKYIIIRANLYWDYCKSRRDAKKMIAICESFGLDISGYDVSENIITWLGYRDNFPHKVIENLRGITWYPDDYGTSNYRIDPREVEDNKRIADEIKKVKKDVAKVLKEKREQYKLKLFEGK